MSFSELCYSVILIFFLVYNRHMLKNLYSFLKYVFKDVKSRKNGKTVFPIFGVTMFCGRQGAGKTVGMVRQLYKIKQRYPNCKIYTNFTLSFSDGIIKSLYDLLTIKNGEDGVIFAIDEIQNEFSSSLSKDFSPDFLRLITQQRKQKIAIFCTSQVYSRVSKPIREQTHNVVICKTHLSRWTFLKCFTTDSYEDYINATNKFKARKNLVKIWRTNFVQTDELRACYDTYEVIQRLSHDLSPKDDKKIITSS